MNREPHENLTFYITSSFRLPPSAIALLLFLRPLLMSQIFVYTHSLSCLNKISNIEQRYPSYPKLPTVFTAFSNISNKYIGTVVVPKGIADNFQKAKRRPGAKRCIQNLSIGWLGHERPDSVRQRFVEATGNKNEN